MAGKRKGFDDIRGTLFFEIARILGHYRDIGKSIPCFLLENVKGLLNHDNGRTFATIYRVLSDLGYTIEFQLLNTKWFLPQNRERIYIVGYIGNRGRPQVFPINDSNSNNNIRYTKTQIKSQHRKNFTRKSEEIISVADYRFDEGLRVREDNISPTLCRSLGSQPYIIRDSEIRKMLPVETCRLQSFPDNWNKYGNYNGKIVLINDNQRYKQMGNSVTVRVVMEIAKKIKNLIKEDK